MVVFRSNKDNDDYLMIDVRVDIGSLLADDKLEVPGRVKKEAIAIYFGLSSFELENKVGYKEDVALRKDSMVGAYLLEKADGIHIINDDLYINYEKIVNAFNIAMYEEECKMVNKIMPLFKNRVSGSKDVLIKEYCEEVLDYILSHSDYYQYLEEIDCVSEEREDSSYLVYENGKYERKSLMEDEKKVKKKLLK